MRVAWLGLILLAVILTGCASVTGYAQPAVVETEAVLLTPGDVWGQTFTARQAGLTGIVLFLQPTTTGDGTLRLQLRTLPPESRTLTSADVPLASIVAPGFYRFTFEPQAAPVPTDYYFTVELIGSGSVRLGGAPGGDYLDGARYHQGAPNDGQFAFNLLYAAPEVYLGLAAQFGQWAWWLGAGLWLFILPGWALLTLIGGRLDALSLAEKFSLAGGIGLALYPVVFVLADAISTPLGTVAAWLPGVIAIGVLLARRWSKRASRVSTLHFSAADGLFWIVIAVVFGIRFWIIRVMDAPAWGDSVQHVVMAQRMLEQGGLFSSWLPYAPYATLTIQFGFSTAVAVFSWLTGLSSLTATLVVGQIINGIAVVGLYPLAVRLARGNRWAGLGAVLLAGLLSPMPAVYVNWGRYAQLAGQAILLPTLWLTWEALEQERLHGPALGLVGATLTGMMLTYYRMPFYYATFILAWLIAWGLPRWLRNRQSLWQDALRLTWIAVITGGLFIPWALRLMNSPLAKSVESAMVLGSTLDQVLADYQFWQNPFTYVPPLLAGLAIFGWVAGMFRRNWLVVTVGLWVVILTALPAGRLIHLPFASKLQSFAVLIALYIPVGLTGGWLIGEAATLIAHRGYEAFISLSLIICALWAGWTQQQVVQPEYTMLSRPDLRAMDWIRTETPPGARFLVEGFRIYNGLSAVGADGGWYIPLLGQRANSMPPQYAMFNEQPEPADYTQRVVAIVAALESTPLSSPEATRQLCAWGVTHIYIGQGQGLVSATPQQLFSPEELLENQALHRVYYQDRVQIFALDPSACSAQP